GVLGGGEQRAIQADTTGLVVHLVLVAAALWDLDRDVEVHCRALSCWSIPTEQSRVPVGRPAPAPPTSLVHRITGRGAGRVGTWVPGPASDPSEETALGFGRRIGDTLRVPGRGVRRAIVVLV